MGRPDNQELRTLSPLGSRRYPLDDAEQRVQISVADGRVWMVGIPRRGDLDQMEADLEERGVRLTEVSWRL